MSLLNTVVCKYHDAGVVCSAKGDVRPYGNCAKCGWCPEVEAARKKKTREERHVQIQERR